MSPLMCHFPPGSLVTHFLGSCCDADFYVAQVKFGHMSNGAGVLVLSVTGSLVTVPPNPCSAAELWLVSPQGAVLLGVTPHFPFSVQIHMGLQIRSLLTYPGVGECRLTSQDGVGVSLTFLPWFCAFHKRPPEHLCAEPSQHLSVMLVFATCELSTSVVSRSLQPYGLKPTRLLHRILQARKLEWVAMPSSGGSS